MTLLNPSCPHVLLFLTTVLVLVLNSRADVLSDYIRFQHIIAKSPTTTTNIGCQAAAFSGFPSESLDVFDRDLRVEYADPATACDSLQVPEGLVGSTPFVVIVYRCRTCACSFEDKVNNAIAIGASAVVIIDEDTQGVLPIVAGSTTENHLVDIPVCMVTNSDGASIVNGGVEVSFFFCSIVCLCGLKSGTSANFFTLCRLSILTT